MDVRLPSQQYFFFKKKLKLPSKSPFVVSIGFLLVLLVSLSGIYRWDMVRLTPLLTLYGPPATRPKDPITALPLNFCNKSLLVLENTQNQFQSHRVEIKKIKNKNNN
jgi:hypothetical protein